MRSLHMYTWNENTGARDSKRSIFCIRGIGMNSNKVLIKNYQELVAAHFSRQIELSRATKKVKMFQPANSSFNAETE
eukprot:9379100-Ditylum_brightwellii.AAC.1